MSLIAHFSFGMNLVESRFDTRANRFGTAKRPEVHEKQPRLFSEHVGMKRRYNNVVSLQLRYNRVYLVRGEHEVAGCGDVAGIRSLKLMASPTPAAGVMVIPPS